MACAHGLRLLALLSLVCAFIGACAAPEDSAAGALGDACRVGADCQPSLICWQGRCSDEIDDTGSESAGYPELDSNEETGPELDSADKTELVGLCAVEGSGRVDEDGYRGEHVHLIVADEGRGEPVCRVSIAIESTKVSPEGCSFSGFACDWAYELRWSKAEIEIDVHGACQDSEANWDDEALAQFEGRTQTLGLVAFQSGPDPVLLELDAAGTWQLAGLADWDPATGTLRYGHATGYCWYRGYPTADDG